MSAAHGRWLPATLAHHFAEALVERWNDDSLDVTIPLSDFMLLTEAEYAAWVEGRYGDVADSLDARAEDREPPAEDSAEDGA